jgi:hypothetical protein
MKPTTITHRRGDEANGWSNQPSQGGLSLIIQVLGISSFTGYARSLFCRPDFGYQSIILITSTGLAELLSGSNKITHHVAQVCCTTEKGC